MTAAVAHFWDLRRTRFRIKAGHECDGGTWGHPCHIRICLVSRAEETSFWVDVTACGCRR